MKNNCKKYLISTRIKETWPKNTKNDLIFSSVDALDSLDGQVKKYKKFVINEYHWKNKKKLEKDFKYLENFYEKVLSKLVKKLNKIHNTNYSKLFWRILIGPWLGIFLHIYFDRWNNIKSLLKKNKIDKAIFLNLDKNILIPYDAKEFIEFAQSDIWNQNIYQNIISNFLKKTKIDYKNISDSKIKEKFLHSLNPDLDSFEVKIKIFLMSIFNLIDKRNYKYFFYKTYLGAFNEIKLSLKFKQFPILFYKTKFITMQKVDHQKRKILNLNTKISNKFEKNFLKALIKNIPKVFIENFEDLINFSKNSNLPQNPKTIFSSNILWYDSHFSFHIAKLKEQKAKLIYGQHGGAYGISKLHWPEKHEIKISDKYLTWGWSDNKNSKKVKRFFILKNTKNNVGRANRENLLLLIKNRIRYVSSLDTSAGTAVFNDYTKFFSNFLFKLSVKIKPKTIIRLPFKKLNESSVDFYSNLRKNFNFSSSNTFYDACNQAKLIVNTVNSTPFLETLSANFPTIIIWDKKTNPIRDNAKKYIEILHENKILYYNPDLAAKFVNQNWNKGIDEWWYDAKTQQAVNKFCNIFANKKQNFLADLKKILK